MEAHKPIKRGNFLIYKNKPLGKGSFACTYLANSVTNPSEQYACKMIDKKQADKQDNAQEREVFKNYFITKVQDEVKTWKELDHPHIVKFYDIIESQNSVYMILEYCEGGYNPIYLVILKAVSKASSHWIPRWPSSTPKSCFPRVPTST